MNAILAVMDFENKSEEPGIQAELIELLIEARAEFKQAKNWVMADKIRDKLAELRIKLKDTEKGTIWEVE
jgi:cysteinyl-tRNA synthetase